MAASTSTQARIAEVNKQLESGYSLDDLAARVSSAPPWWQTALWRAAFVGSFDQVRFRELIVPEFPSADFRACIAMPGIERARPLPDETYRMKDAIAAEQLETWLKRQGPEAIRSFSEEVLGRLPQTTDDIERLRFLIPVKPEEALGLFDRLFGAADRAFDLARCHALVELLRELDNFEAGGRSVPLRLLSPALRERCDTLGRYVAARGHFVEDYSKSANFLDREELTAPTWAFLDGPDRWLLTIYGRGGIGKTMFVRWLVAREAIPRPRCVPVAKLDFDDINISKLAQFPGLIFIRFAEQLNRQMKYAPFEEYLGSYAPFAALLLPPARLPRTVNPNELESEFQGDPNLNEALAESFAAKLTGPVMCILDTLEEGVLHFPDALRATLSSLRSVRDRSSHLKVLLSGRYDLRERGFLYASDPEPIALEPLTDADAKRLLCDIIGLKPSDVVEATIRKSEGNPFILSLIAQLVQSGSVKTVAEVDALKPEFAYLIKRIIDRIPDSQRAVRWVIRYGVVPRSLTREFLEAVMRPHLERELASAEEEGHRDQLLQYADSFPRASELDVATVWQDLQQYADNCGWLRADQEHLRFQPEVVRPMRALLREEPVFGELHLSANAWFSDQARRAEETKNPDAWVRATAEALYHCFAADEAEAQSRWHAALNAAWAQRIDRRSALLGAVIDLLDFEALAETTDAAPPVEPRVAAYALREMAKVRAGVGFGTVPPPDSPNQIHELLRLATKIASDDSDSAGERLVRIALAVASRDYEEAVALGLKLTSDEPESPAECFTLHILLARAFAATQNITASDHYERACQALNDQENRPLRAAVWTEFGRTLREFGDWFGAMRAYTEAHRATQDMGDLLVLSTDIAELMMEGGRYEAALAAISVGELENLRDPAARPREAFRRSRIRALCEIAHGRPDRAEPIVRSARAAPGAPLQEAQLLELHGELAAAQYNPRTAAALFERACQHYADGRYETDANQARLKRLRVVKDQIGDWRLARDLLKSFNARAKSFSWLGRLVAVEAAHLSSLTGDMNLLFLDDQFAAIAREKEPEKHVDPYLAQLESIQPQDVRYPLLKIFAALPTDRKPPAPAPDVMAIVPPPEASDPDFFPNIFGSLDLLGFVARKQGRECLQAALTHDRLSVLPRLLDAVERLQADLPPVHTVRQCLARSGTNGFGFATAVKYMRLALDRSKPDAAIEVSGMLASIPDELRGTQIEAMHSFNTSRLPDQKERAKRQARHHAAEVLRQLGQDQNVAQIVGPLYGAHRQPDTPWSKQPRATIALREVWVELPLVSRRELVPYDLAKRLAGPQGELISELKRALAEWELTDRVGVELDVDGAAAAMMPWEWALGDREICFRSSARLPEPRSTITRIIGAKLHARVRQFLAFFRPLQVIILRPPLSSQESTGRGFELQSRRPLTAIYATHGVRAIEPKGLEAADVKPAMEEHDPDVVHIQAAVVERSRGLQLDLPIKTAVPSVEYLIEQFKDGSKPVIILDPPRPMEDVETARQLLMRNRFAADVVATGRVRAVLAAGLLQPRDLQYVTERLAHRLGGFPLLRELADLYRREMDPDRFSSEGVALFATGPDEILP